MDLILHYYNNTRHETLTSTLFKAYPELKSRYRNGISPAIMDSDPELERLFAMECMKHNYFVQSKQGYDINIGSEVQIVNESNPLEKKRTILNKYPHMVIDRKGNIYQLMHDGKASYRSRFGIKP